MPQSELEQAEGLGTILGTHAILRCLIDELVKLGVSREHIRGRTLLLVKHIPEGAMKEGFEKETREAAGKFVANLIGGTSH